MCVYLHIEYGGYEEKRNKTHKNKIKIDKTGTAQKKYTQGKLSLHFHINTHTHIHVLSSILAIESHGYSNEKKIRK